MRADLHIHSVFSDGKMTVEEIAKRVKDSGIDIFALTDHDTMNGVQAAAKAAKAEGVLFVPGIEISADNGVKIHVLGYGCDPESEAFQAFLQNRIKKAILRTEDSIAKLAKVGIHISLEDVEAFHVKKEEPLHAMQIAKAIRAKGYRYQSDKDAYRQCVAPSAPGYSDADKLSAEEAVEIIVQSGGFASLAHPGRIALEEEPKERLIASLCDHGLGGIEAVYTLHTEEETAGYRGLAQKYGLLVTGGSDTHMLRGKRIIGLPTFVPDEKLLLALHIL